MSLPFNKVCELEDFEDLELSELIGEIFSGDGSSAPGLQPEPGNSKQWEIAMSCRALRTFGLLDREAVVLGVGAGTEATSFFLTRHVRQVVATDLYLTPAPWSDVAPPLMLVDPGRFSPYPFERSRLAVQHMDGRMLRYPDDTFDAVFSSGSIEHFGGLDLVANAAFEMGRVVRPGGVVTLATEFKIAGPAGDGWEPGTLILDAERIQRYIVEASGLEPVDPLRTTLSERTLRSERDLTAFLEGARALSDGRPGPGGYPNVVLLHEGYLFCSVHLALRKPDAYPVSDNRWARPGAGAERAVAEGVREVERQLIAVRSRALERQPTALEASAHPELEALLAEWDMYWSGVISSRIARRLPGPLASLYRAYLRVRYLGPAWHAESRLLHVLARLVRSRQEDESALLRRELDDLRSDLRDLEARLREQQATPGETERPRAR